MKKARLWVFGLVLLGLSFLFDPLVINSVDNIRLPILNGVMQAFVYIGSEMVVLSLLTFFLVVSSTKKKFLVPWWITFFVSMGLVYILKILIARSRPDTIITLIFESDFAFPSGHATAAFSSLPIIYRTFKNKTYWLSYLSLIALSRIYLGVHYLSDVVGGALLGLLVGTIILKFFENY